MRVSIIAPILATIQLCSAGWPCCLKGTDDNRDGEGYTLLTHTDGCDVTYGTCVDENASICPSEGGEAQAPIDLEVLDISRPDPQIFHSFDYYYDDVEARLIVPQRRLCIAKIMNGSEPVWMSSFRKTTEYIKVYLRNGAPELVNTVVSVIPTLHNTYFELNDGKWTHSLETHLDKFKTLKVIPASFHSFSLNISVIKDTEHCTSFEVVILGTSTRYFFPKYSHYAVRVQDGEKALWTSDGHSKCISCTIFTYPSGKQQLVIELVGIKGSDFRYFDRAGRRWKKVTRKAFIKNKKKEMGNSK
ncbi:signal peptide containing protein [Theileria equi strain WA]|uniref:Signal peptide containing protein n=1 Tax=Theileria equi strain WA TaxID=1537102 RepID=L1LAB0_THEEQ|nr:signal peptide containing protein [Theileria equi strain WA]EKX72402.1 signal peptide containing protein [Theileria equi strain WA]|eukprot:XP_004831854.1 signal peptide containing protein [Theileria equi strain WA]